MLDPGRVPEITEMVRSRPRLAVRLVELLWDDDAGVASRAADVLERISRDAESFPKAPAGMAPAPAVRRAMMDAKESMISLLPEARWMKLRWNLAYLIPRLELKRAEAQRAAELLRGYLEDRSSIVKTAALQGLADLARQDGEMLLEVQDLLRVTGRSGTPAMRARSRILLKRQERRDGAGFDALLGRRAKMDG